MLDDLLFELCYFRGVVVECRPALDVMTHQDGPETLQRLRADERTADVRVVFMTARTQSSDVQRFLGLGALGVIAKPFDPMTLSDRIREIWDNLD